MVLRRISSGVVPGIAYSRWTEIGPANDDRAIVVVNQPQSTIPSPIGQFCVAQPRGPFSQNASFTAIIFSRGTASSVADFQPMPAPSTTACRGSK